MTSSNDVAIKDSDTQGDLGVHWWPGIGRGTQEGVTENKKIEIQTWRNSIIS